MVGQENNGIDTTNCIRHNCMNVTMYSLDTHVSNFVPKGVSIDYPSVDAKGHNYDVLLSDN